MKRTAWSLVAALACLSVLAAPSRGSGQEAKGGEAQPEIILGQHLKGLMTPVSPGRGPGSEAEAGKTPLPGMPEIGIDGGVSGVRPPASVSSGPAGEDPEKNKGGLKNVLRLFTGPDEAKEPAIERTPVAADHGEAGDENQKRVNELGRLATSNIEKGRITEAVKNINELIALKPYDANYHFALGLCFRQMGRYREALKKYQDVLDLGGPKALVAILKAEAYAMEGDRDKVMQHLREAAIGGRNIITDVGLLPALAGYQQDTEFIKLALQLEKFGVTSSRGHDPFTNPFPKFDMRPSEQGQPVESLAALTPEEQEKLLLDARKTYERVKFYIKLEDEAKAMNAYASLREMTKKKDLITIPKIANDFRILLAQLEGLEIEIEGIKLKYYYGQAQAKLKDMREFFTDGEYKRVELLHGEVVKLTQEMQQVNKNYKPVADQILAASGRWNERAQVRKEFDLRRPNIQGIVISDTGKLALLNNRLIKQGETFDDFRVVRVESNKVTFRYKGEDIPLLFRRY